MKTNKFHILFLFILFSIALFLLLRMIMIKFFIFSNDPFTELGQAINFLPYLLGAYTILLEGLSIVGVMFFKRKEKIKIYQGFKYSMIYSSSLFVLYLIFLIYYLRT